MKIFSNQSVNVSVGYVNANGLPANVDGEVTWESSNPEVVAVQVNASDSKRASITGGPSAGTAIITASADSDLGSGVMEVSAELEVVVVARGVAIGGEITPDVVSGPGPTTPDNTLPQPPVSISNDLPGRERPVDPGFGQTAPGRPDQGLPGSQPGPDNALPGTAGRPDQGLPDTAEPK